MKRRRSIKIIRLRRDEWRHFFTRWLADFFWLKNLSLKKWWNLSLKKGFSLFVFDWKSAKKNAKFASFCQCSLLPRLNCMNFEELEVSFSIKKWIFSSENRPRCESDCCETICFRFFQFKRAIFVCWRFCFWTTVFCLNASFFVFRLLQWQGTEIGRCSEAN